MSAGGKLAPGRHAPILFRFMSFPIGSGIGSGKWVT